MFHEEWLLPAPGQPLRTGLQQLSSLDRCDAIYHRTIQAQGPLSSGRVVHVLGYIVDVGGRRIGSDTEENDDPDVL